MKYIKYITLLAATVAATLSIINYIQNNPVWSVWVNVTIWASANFLCELNLARSEKKLSDIKNIILTNECGDDTINKIKDIID